MKTDKTNSFRAAATGSSRRKSDSGRNILLPLVGVLLLILVAALVAIRGHRQRVRESIAASEAMEASIAASLAEAEAAAAEQTAELREFTPCEIPELTELIHEYFTARLAGDSTRILEMYGRSDISTDGELEKKLEAQAAWIQTFLNIQVYDVPGVEDGDRFCLVQYDVDFRRTDTLAPGIMYLYTERGADGSYHLVENLMKDRVDFVSLELAGAQAQSLIEDTNRRLKEALDTDSELALIYTSFRNGEIYKESNLDMNREQEVDLFLDPEDSILIDESEETP